ncbi:alpha-ketoglutarate-dependent dioxygenase alkB homolog 6-like isoform X1 [Centruroides sculpturatus]|uniref:alpha-ketoglutarate-dependent dioxygenase alkB homolog 6-like isoform X1 n=1 Tax=Centruroides sculpturatus TaxID=218467 RepID=UPI000C6CB1B6|nr:alpha-ketoglutarate-dependent dioxygenase alkB homolog 6-like isoform X1 [Centruroides sculpturatus]
MDCDKFEINRYILSEVPPTIYYIRDFITESEEELLIRKVDNAPKPKWTTLSNRRLQNWGGLPHPKGMVVEPMPNWLQIYSKKIAELGVFEDKVPNHVLVNEYLPGQGIMPHEDGPLFYPTITTVNLGSHTILNYYHKINEEDSSNNEKEETNSNRLLASVLLEPRSLLVVKDDMYHKYLHGIDEKVEDEINNNIVNIRDHLSNYPLNLKRNRRISLTFRYVPKFIKTKLFSKQY